MAFQQGDVYQCPDSNCGCELTVTKAPRPRWRSSSNLLLRQDDAEKELRKSSQRTYPAQVLREPGIPRLHRATEECRVLPAGAPKRRSEACDEPSNGRGKTPRRRPALCDAPSARGSDIPDLWASPDSVDTVLQLSNQAQMNGRSHATGTTTTTQSGVQA
jgi:hypothetical protein